MKNLKPLFYKNFLIFKTNYKKYLLIYLSPFLVLLFLMLFQYWATTNFNFRDKQRPINNLSPIPKCIGKQCITLGYIVHGHRQPHIDYVLKHLIKSNHLSQMDIKQLNIKPTQVLDYLSNYPNKTQAVIIFCTNQNWVVDNITIPCYANQYHLNFYTIVFNLTLFHRVPYFSNLHNPYPKDEVTLKLKQDIDEGLIRYYFQANNKNDLYYNITLSSFPSTASRFVKGMNVTSQYGSFFFMIPYLVLLVMQASQLLKQKQNKLRIGLNIVGVSHFQFYLSQIVTYFTHVVIISSSFCLFAYVLDFKFWTNAIMWFNFMVFVVNGTIIGLLAFCVTAAVDERKLGMSIIYGFVLYSIVMQWLFSGGFLFQFLYFTNPNWTKFILRLLFNTYPSFHFSKIFNDITRKADTHFDTWNNAFVEGTTYTFNDLFQQRSTFFQFPVHQGFIIPSTFYTFMIMLSTAGIYLTALSLLDFFVESNRGYRHSLFKKSRKQSTYLINDQQQDLVKVVNLQKKYNQNVFALRGVSFNVSEGEIVGLLGQNGAGKSTLINIMIGALGPSSGKVQIDGRNVEEQIKEVRKVIGVCPQFDILWDELTAQQHIYIFSKLKSIENTQQSIHHSLQSVNLWQNRNGRIETFSGGMKRRLSLAISFLGNPKMIVLDEPTTGMDVKIRHQTWKIILSLRNKSSILLTTHNMEQAECLSDRILIMSKGKLVAEGSPLQLKKHFGQGYVIRGLHPQTMEQIMWRCKQEQLQQGLEKIQKLGLQNWSLRQTTLQQVFLSASNMF